MLAPTRRDPRPTRCMAIRRGGSGPKLRVGGGRGRALRRLHLRPVASSPPMTRHSASARVQIDVNVAPNYASADVQHYWSPSTAKTGSARRRRQPIGRCGDRGVIATHRIHRDRAVRETKNRIVVALISRIHMGCSTASSCSRVLRHPDIAKGQNQLKVLLRYQVRRGRRT